jgi:hypothetical protein
MRGRCSMRDISVRKRGKRMPCARHIERDCIDLEQLHTALSANTCPAPSERGRNAALPERPRRARIPPTACSCDVPMVASVFVRIPVQGGEGCSMATRARTAHRSGNREASARTRCARMACRVQWRASVSWRCLKTLGTHSALMPATCRDANEAQESNVRIQ